MTLSPCFPCEIDCFHAHCMLATVSVLLVRILPLHKGPWTKKIFFHIKGFPGLQQWSFHLPVLPVWNMFIPVICFSSCSRLLLTGSPENKSFVSPLHQKKKRCQKLPPAVETQDQGIKKAKTSALWLNYSCFYLNFLLLSTRFKLISLSLPYDTSCLTCRVQLSEVISITCLHSTEEKPSKL